MINNILFLFLIFSPGLRGIGSIYFLILLISFLFSDIFKYLTKFEWIKKIWRQNILFKILFIIYVLCFCSVIRVSSSTNILDISVGILRLSLPFILLISSTQDDLDDQNKFQRSLFCATTFAAIISAASIYFQAAYSQGWEILSSSPLIRKDLIRYGSTFGNVNSAGLGIPISCIVIFYQKKIIYAKFLKSKLLKIEQMIIKIPSISLITFLLLSTIFTLSRTALINIGITIFSTFFLWGLNIFCKKKKFHLNQKKIFKYFLKFLLGIFPVLIIFPKFIKYINLNLSFLGITSKHYPLAYRDLKNDILSRALDNRPTSLFNIQDFLFGNGLDSAGGILGFKQTSIYYHNTILNLYQLIGILGPILVFSFIVILIKRSIISLRIILSKEIISQSKLNNCLYITSAILLYLPNILTFAGVFFIPLWIVPLLFNLGHKQKLN
jgi:hypothetical protein